MQKKLLEAALFMSPKPLAMDELVKITGAGSAAQLQGMIAELQQDYQQRGMVINETPFGYQMQVQYELMSKVSHLTPYADLSEGCKRTLALAVYKEPITQSEVIKIQGNKAYNYVKGLEEMGLVKAERYGRTKLLKLTAEFERYFGMRKEQVRALIEQQIGQPAPANLNAFLPPTAPEPADETATGLKQLFEGSTIKEEDITTLSASLTSVAKKKLAQATAIPSLDVLDLWDAPYTEPAPAERAPRHREPAARETVVQASETMNVALQTARAPLRPAPTKAGKTSHRAPSPNAAASLRPVPPKTLQLRTPAPNAAASLRPLALKPQKTAASLRSLSPKAPKATPFRTPKVLKSAAPHALQPLRPPSRTSKAPRLQPLKSSSLTHPKPAIKKGTQMVLAAGGAEKPAEPVDTKKKKVRRKVMHKSAVKEETRDEKNIFSSEGEIRL